MSTQSTKTARQSPKTPGRTAKKNAKVAKRVKNVTSARSSGKKSSKSARRTASARPARASALGSARAASKPARKTAVKAAAKGASKAPKRVETPSEQALQRMIRTLSPPVQPVVTIEAPIMAHKYQVGETVYFTSPTFGRAAATGSYTVVKQLPSESDDYQYRIKSDGEAFERVAKESQLDRA